MNGELSTLKYMGLSPVGIDHIKNDFCGDPEIHSFVK